MFGNGTYSEMHEKIGCHPQLASIIGKECRLLLNLFRGCDSVVLEVARENTSTETSRNHPAFKFRAPEVLSVRDWEKSTTYLPIKSPERQIPPGSGS